ncbi:hypothetical protein CLOM_g16604 [Closterium sp. NIES-68]|nr:hypothetical protein CLOM_g16604 [Closterium sp. NIES-68]GJP78025.1 hypothetical protein CLOP_g8357 [Closterium sp. NIES-67]
MASERRRAGGKAPGAREFDADGEGLIPWRTLLLVAGAAVAGAAVVVAARPMAPHLKHTVTGVATFLQAARLIGAAREAVEETRRGAEAHWRAFCEKARGRLRAGAERGTQLLGSGQQRATGDITGDDVTHPTAGMAWEVVRW